MTENHEISPRPVINNNTDLVAGLPVVHIPEGEKKSRNVVTIVQTPEGFGYAKIGTPDQTALFRNEAENHEAIQRVWPHGVKSVSQLARFTTDLLPDTLGGITEFPVLVTKLESSMEDLHETITSKGKMDIRSAIKRLYSVAIALDAFKASKRVHRDIKPANVFMDKGVGILGDFEFGVPEGHSDPKGVLIGTPGYFSPEHRRGEPLTNGTNVWGFGATVYFALTRQHLMAPVTAKDEYAPLFSSEETYNKYIEQRIALLPPAVQGAFRKAVAFDPAKRYDSCTEFMLVLDQAERSSRNMNTVSTRETSAAVPERRTTKEQVSRSVTGPGHRRPPHTPQHVKRPRRAKTQG